MATMQCQRCKAVKDETEFHWKWKDVERMKVCKECRKIDSKNYRDKSLDKRLAYNREYVARNREKFLDYLHEYYATHGKEREEYRARSAAHRAETNARIYRENKEERSRLIKIWRSENKDKILHYAKKHNAFKRGSEICDFTNKQWSEMIASCDGRCVYCGKESDRLEQDHILPVSRGGNHTKDNIVPCCKSCNSSKKNKKLDEWKKTPYFRDNCANSKI
jgi:hypothetical protein